MPKGRSAADWRVASPVFGRGPTELAVVGSEPHWRRRHFDRTLAIGVAGGNRFYRNGLSASGFPRADREIAPERRSESGNDRAPGSAVVEQTKAGRQGAGSKGRATNF